MNEHVISLISRLFEIYQLPFPVQVNVLPHTGGVYFLANEAGEIEYIGQISDFSFLNRAQKICEGNASNLFIVEIESPNLRASVQAALIGAIRPRSNTSFNPDQGDIPLKEDQHRQDNLTKPSPYIFLSAAQRAYLTPGQQFIMELYYIFKSAGLLEDQDQPENTATKP